MSKLRRTVLATAIVIATTLGVSAQTFTTLIDFDGHNGANPYLMALVQGADGNLYGTTENGGRDSGGTLFNMTLSDTHAYYSFAVEGDGGYPYAGLTLGYNGYFYGTTTNGGAGFGTVFAINSRGALTTLHTFCAQPPYCADGGQPWGGLIQGIDGNFYGTTIEYGVDHGGTVFKMTPAGVLTPLYSFCAKSNCADGDAPASRLIQASDGRLYGTTLFGGNPICGPDGCGTVFSITPGGRLMTVHAFDNSDGYYPIAGLIQASDGYIYGATSGSGVSGGGTIFRITSTGELTTLYTFCTQPNCMDGAGPTAGLIQATDGNLYGTTSGGGANDDGTIFSITLAGSLTTLHSFDGNGPNPTGGLMQHTNGTFYGTTSNGGKDCCDGTVFSLSMGLNPFVAFVRGTAKANQQFGLLGQGFTGTTNVMLNSVPANFKVISDTFIKATVPQGATTGYVTVTTPTGTLTSNVPFHVIP